jgi:glycosyltransferase involved in cell wall biosynthesis
MTKVGFMNNSNTKPKAISVVIDFRMCKASGIGTYIKNIVPYLVDTYDVTLLGNKQELSLLSWSGKVKIIDIKSKIYSISEQFELPRKIPKCDVFWSPHYNVPLFPIRAKKRMVTVHDVYHLAHAGELSLLQKLYSKVVLQGSLCISHAVLTVSEFSKQEMMRLCHIRPSKIAVVPNAVDTKVFNLDSVVDVKAKYNLPDDYILFVGNVKPNKNLKNLLLALEINKDLKLVVAGKKEGFINGDNESSEILKNSPELARRVYFTGFIEDADMPSIYANATVFVFPSLYEGFGIPPLEAQACLCPVVSSAEASLREVCGDSVIFCDPLSPLDISDKIDKVRCSMELRNELVAKGAANIKRFSWEKSANMILFIIKSISS